jgi:CAAX protease family protein
MQSELPQYSAARLVLLHLIPGAVITVVYLALVPAVRAAGWPPLVALLCAGFVGTVPVQLGHLMFWGRRLSGRWTLSGVLGYTAPAPMWQYVVLVPAACLIAILVLVLTRRIDLWLTRSVFSWLPRWYFYSDLSAFAGYSRPVLAATFGLRIVLDGFVFPIIEELYFRGYLLPRMERFGQMAPVLNHVLFTAYHLWQPHNWPTILFGIYPMVWVAWWKRNYRFAVWIHLVLNVIGSVVTYAAVVR